MSVDVKREVTELGTALTSIKAVDELITIRIDDGYTICIAPLSKGFNVVVGHDECLPNVKIITSETGVV